MFKFVLVCLLFGGLSAFADAWVPVCDRSPIVREAIMKAYSGAKCSRISQANVEKIDYLTIEGGKQTSFLDGDFSGLVNLTWLSIIDTKVESLQPGIFAPLVKVENLDVTNGRLREVQAGVFNLPRLRVLNLSRNGLERIHPEAFLGASLEFLHLYENRLGTLARGTFAGLEKAEVIDLSRGGITDIEPGAFPVFEKNVELRLSDNSISFLRAGVLTLPNNFSLHLDNSGVRVIEAGAFDQLTSLRDLRLMWLDIREFPPGLFDKMAALEDLGVFLSSLELIPLRAFAHNRNLKRLNLSFSPLTLTSLGAFNGFLGDLVLPPTLGVENTPAWDGSL